DIRQSLAEGTVGPFFDDEFGDTFTTIYAFSAEGVDHARLREIVRSAREQLLRIKGVEKAQLFGVQDEKIYLEFDQRRLAELGLDATAVADQLTQQNALVPGGIVEAGTDRVPLRLSGGFHSIDEVAAAPIRAGGTTIRLADIATIARGYVDPPVHWMRFD